MFWLILLLVNVCSGVLIGTLVKRLHYGANKDPLTGLHNRQCFYDRINYEIEKMKRTKLPLSLVLIDRDNFKTINDTYGHPEGDKVLVELAGIFKTQTRSGDTISIGITTVYQAHDAEKIMSIVDRALYKAKENNKNTVVLLTE